jgi:hypothetical protein
MFFNLVCLTDMVFQYVAAKAFGKVMEVDYLCDALKGSIEFYVRLPVIGGFENIFFECL